MTSKNVLPVEVDRAKVVPRGEKDSYDQLRPVLLCQHFTRPYLPDTPSLSSYDLASQVPIELELTSSTRSRSPTIP